ncbi:hypothetical protein BX666DRAFT_1853199, partial [Dichotomocladium elegans]
SISRAQWRLFWALAFTSGTRNLWFRIFHGTLPTAQRLHSISPSFMLSPASSICGDPTETVEHFLFRCPAKWRAWENFWNPIFFADPDLTAVSLLCLRPHYVQVTSTILWAIWCGHWGHILRFRPFNLLAVASHARKLWQRSSKELALTPP